MAEGTDAFGEWIGFAERDLRAAEVLADQEGALGPVVLFHCQQAAEKALKAVIATSGSVPPPIHTLLPLLQRCLTSRPALADLRADLEELEPYSVSPRYPDVAEEYDRESVERGLAAARRVLEEVRRSR